MLQCPQVHPTSLRSLHLRFIIYYLFVYLFIIHNVGGADKARRRMPNLTGAGSYEPLDLSTD